MPIKTPSKPALTKAEDEVLRYLSDEFLSLKQIQQRRQCSRQAIYKIIKSLKEKGWLTGDLKRLTKSEAMVDKSTKIRLHGQEFNIKILFQSPIYQKLLKKSNILYLNGHTIKLYKGSIEVYAGEGISFYGNTAQDAFSRSLGYWRHLFARLEHDLKVVLIKERSRNIRIVNQHFAKGNSEICENALNNNERIKIYADEDGKLAFITDQSFGIKEDETLHPTTAKYDREAIDKQVNDWRLNNPPTNSQLAQYVALNAQNLNDYAQHLKAHVKSIQDLGKGVKELVKLIKELKSQE